MLCWAWPCFRRKLPASFSTGSEPLLLAAEKDSLQNLGIDFREIDWSFLALEEGLELDSLSAGSLQPNFFDEDENIARTALLRGGRISINITGQENTLLAQVLLDGDPSTAYVVAGGYWSRNEES